MHKRMLLALSVLLALTVFLFAGCGDGGSYDDTALRKQLEQLEQQLKDQKDTYDTTVKSLQDKITAAEKQLTTVGGDNTKLKNEIAALKKELETLQNANQTKTFNIGETFTYKLADTELFSIKLELVKEERDYIQFNIKNIQMPYKKVSAYCSFTTDEGLYNNLNAAGNAEIGETAVYKYPTSLLTRSKLLYIGFPIENSSSCVPYAIFKLA